MWFSVGFAVSCIIGIYLLSGAFLGWLAIAAVCLAAVSIFVKGKPCKIVGLTLFGFALGVVWMYGYQALYLQPAERFNGQTVITTIEIADYSYPTAYTSAADGKVELDGKDYRVRVYFDDVMDLKPGDRVHGNFRFAMTTPNGEAESEYYQGKGIFLVAYADETITVRPTEKIPVKFFAVELRRKIMSLLDSVFPADTRGFARALLLGDSSLLTYEEDTSFKVSGIRHIIAVSGLHVSILFSLAYTLATRRRLSTALLGIPVLLLFAAVAGFTPSIMRACIMQILVILALLLNKEYDPPTALAFAVLVMLALNPMTVTSVSFQLSVGCMIGIFLFSKRIQQYLFRKMGAPTGKRFWAWFVRGLSSGVSMTISAMSLTAPLIAWYFGMVSLVGVLTNLLTLWAVSIIFYGIILVCLCGAIWLPLGNAVGWTVSWLIRLVMLIAKTLASLPFAAVYTCSIYIVLWIAVCYLLIAVFLLCKRKWPLLLVASIVACLCVSIGCSYAVPRMDDFRVTVFDVGEGQAILLQNKGKYYLVDCGGDDPEKVADLVSQNLLSQGVFTLDGVILTHYDTDHADGILNLLTRIKTRALFLPDIPDDGEIKAQLMESWTHKIHWIRENRVIGCITCIPAPVDSKNVNENSLCVLFQPENYDILITGDRGVTGENALLQAYELPRLELLVAGHHGAASATNLPLLRATRPDAVVVSTGGKYGHPAKDVLYRLELFGCGLWRTDRDGTVIFRR